MRTQGFRGGNLVDPVGFIELLRYHHVSLHVDSSYRYDYLYNLCREHRLWNTGKYHWE